MATQVELALLRDMVSEPDDGEGWTDERLEVFIESGRNVTGTTNLRKAAAAVWEAKAANYVEHNDVSESGSSHRLSQSFDHAQKMAVLYGSTSTDPTVVAAATRMSSHRIVRPSSG